MWLMYERSKAAPESLLYLSTSFCFAGESLSDSVTPFWVASCLSWSLAFE